MSRPEDPSLPDQVIAVRMTRAQLWWHQRRLDKDRERWRDYGVALSPAAEAALNALLRPAVAPFGTDFDGPQGTAARSECTVREAAERLGIRVRAVRSAIARGALTARRPDGRGPHLIDERSVVAYARRRNARASMPD